MVEGGGIVETNKGTILPDQICSDMVLLKRPLRGHVTLDFKKMLKSPFTFKVALKFLSNPH
jgi:hypothetical protein